MLGCFQIHKETPENILHRGSKFISFNFIPIIIFSILEGLLIQHLFYRDIFYITAILLAVYILLKDFFLTEEVRENDSWVSRL